MVVIVTVPSADFLIVDSILMLYFWLKSTSNGNHTHEKTELGTVKGGVKRDGKKYVVVYRIKEQDDIRSKPPDDCNVIRS